MIDSLQQVGERHGGGEPRGERQCELCVVDGGQALLQALPGRVPAPRVLVLPAKFWFVTFCYKFRQILIQIILRSDKIS